MAEIGIGLMGLGVVGSGVAQVLQQKGTSLGQQIGVTLALRRVLVRTPHKPRPVALPEGLLTTNPADLLDNPQCHIIVELLGGEEPAATYIRRALEGGKHVVTANKEVIAKHGPSLLRLAQQRQVHLLFEASVGGGIPLIGPLQRDLLANDILSLRAIINGTTNYILTRMARDGVDYQVALREAQEKGYAEPDPTNDVEGIDAAYKLAVLSLLAFRSYVPVAQIYREGITHLKAKDFRYAHELGYEIKLLAIGRKENGKVQARVHPVLVPAHTLLAKVDGAYNAIEVQGDLVGKVVFHGLGAGPAPTSSAVVNDILTIARTLKAQARPLPWVDTSTALPLRPMGDLLTQYYLRLNVADRPGVLAQIARILGDLSISIASVIQKDADPTAGTAEIVIMTHPAREGAVQEALGLIRRLPVVREVSNLIRVEAE
ncbi:MAG: homoserine dehydrogenase [Dehalococcoidia bacterium]|nr:homoserine dehydrogenase [Dehalococcoidia bacterium]MDW8120059.1 homoserine dehydrogenase [Chloroflexota bacterium]